MQERAKKHSPAERADEETGSAAPAAPSDAGERIKAELDDILDEIDGVLEENAEEFVKNYVQKGGE
ncbi:MAG: ubiquitin-like protein Pup [Actinomycetes bacterium]|jgi:ubiquitin-like protein Pup